MQYKTKAAKWNGLKAANSTAAPEPQPDSDGHSSSANSLDSFSAESQVLNPASVNHSVFSRADSDVVDSIKESGTLAAGVIQGDI